MKRLIGPAALLCTALFFIAPLTAVAQDAPFITMWDTENSGDSNDDQIIIPGEGEDYSIEWEEVGNPSNSGSETVAKGDTTLTFPNSGIYRISISGGFTRIHLGQLGYGDTDKIEKVEQWGDIQWSTMEEAFSFASNLQIAADDVPDFSNGSNMSRMFRGASSLTATNSNIGQWDVSNVTKMEQTFSGADSFNKNIGDWNVSNVDNMRGLFSSASSFNQDISSWNTGNVTNMSQMFRNSSSFNKDISTWETGNVTDMDRMFNDATSFNQDIGSWDVSSVTEMSSMFEGSGLSPEKYDRTLIGWSRLDLVSGVYLGGLGLNYCDGGPFRTHLIEGFNWNVNDYGQRSGCPDILAASNANFVDGDGTFGYGEVGLEITISGLIGGDRVTAARYSTAPRNANIKEDNISQYRVIIAGGGIGFFDSVDLRFAVSELGGIDQPDGVTMYRRSQPGYGDFTSLQTSVDDNGTPDDISDDTLSATVTSASGKEGFGEFVFASDSNPLPVELASFEGTTTENGIRLRWQTAAETNNSGFDVQRQAEGSSWTTIGFVEGAGTTSEARSYRYVDTDMPYDADQLKYRLRQKDVDGTNTLSDQVTIERTANRLRLRKVSPNPASNSATVRFAIPERRTVTLQLYDELGRKIRTVNSGKMVGRQSVELDVSDLSSGSYFLQLNDGATSKTQRLTIIR